MEYPKEIFEAYVKYAQAINSNRPTENIDLWLRRFNDKCIAMAIDPIKAKAELSTDNLAGI